MKLFGVRSKKSPVEEPVPIPREEKNHIVVQGMTLGHYFLKLFSNLENSVGFVAGIDSKFVPYASCEDEQKTKIIPCPEEKVFRWE